ncbi:hypothetical protein ACFPL7_14345 [Dongia soli]|uniref:Uncharacterized protein n=1 Tax=Dongia soli TaxID=600628 RepID=A0ABU5ED04_9PROT|nr:hypothetical protein [Dongia soli]MDY0883924.1 hypothetical protein [Dongia soli]
MRRSLNRNVPGTQDRVVPFHGNRAAAPTSRTVSVDIEVDLIRQCREDWRRGETEIWRHVTVEAELRRAADGSLRLHGIPGRADGLTVPPAEPVEALTRFEEPGICVTLASAAIRDAELALPSAIVISLPFARAS